MGTAATAIVITGLGLTGIFSRGSCSAHNTYNTKYSVGTCIRSTRNIGQPREVGYWHIIIGKTATSYIMCQGQYGNTWQFDEHWYGCEPQIATDIFNDAKYYMKAECPNWSMYKGEPYSLP